MQNRDIKLDLRKTQSIFDWSDEILKPVLAAIYSIITQIEAVLSEVD